jgi:hypothetical protein
LGNRKAVPCDFVCEGIFASAVSEEIMKPTLPTFLLLFKKMIILNPLMKAPYIRSNDAQ